MAHFGCLHIGNEHTLHVTIFSIGKFLSPSIDVILNFLWQTEQVSSICAVFFRVVLDFWIAVGDDELDVIIAAASVGSDVD